MSKNAWLSDFKIVIKSIIKVILLWSRNLTFVEINKFVQISAPVYIRLRKYLIGKINQYYAHHPIRLGGPHVTVQIDDTKLNHNVRSHLGRGPIRAARCLCIVDTFTQPAKGFATMIPDRRAETIIPIIESVVRPGSIIHTDEEKAYHALKESLQNYEHLTVCYKYNFVDLVTGIHILHVESWNNKIKTQIKACVV